eukprot:514168-Rhodomonas_salina.1
MYPPVSSWVQSTTSSTSPELGIQSVLVTSPLSRRFSSGQSQGPACGGPPWWWCSAVLRGG